ncbi:MAG: carbohydrate-binding domain-containing protein [Paludibacteraceae bacterium]|nr:carbohydrate-binding domain-containing protein [Paludibacteraceae bacterium]
MKRNISLFIAVFVGVLMLAQTKINFHMSDSSVNSFQISDIDTIRFSNGNVKIEGVDSQSYEISLVDSATFSFDSLTSSIGDTVFVRYDGNQVSVDNPYSSIDVYSDGANVIVSSAANIKGVVYYLSGQSDEGSFQLTPDRGYTLVFDNLSLSNANAPIVLNESVGGESFTATLNLIGSSSISDGPTNSLKAAFYTKSKLKVNEGFFGSLTVKGVKKHAINSSKNIEFYGGDLIIEGAEEDGINADALKLYDGEVVISNVLGDGVDCSEQIVVEGGSITIDVSSDDVKGLKSDSIIVISGGLVAANVSGRGSKAIKSDKKVVVRGGSMEMNLSATEPFVGEDNSYSYNAAISCDSDIFIEDAANIIIKGTGVAAKGLNSDANISVLGGSLAIELTGNYYEEKANSDTASVVGLKSDVKTSISAGIVNVKIGENAYASKGIKSDYVDISGGEVTIQNNGKYFSTITSSSSSSTTNPWGQGGGMNRPGGGSSTISVSNATVSKAIKGNHSVSITGGTINLTVPSGKGITCDNTITLGTKNGLDSDFILTIVAGSKEETTYSKGGENNRTKYSCCPKGINCDGTVEINSGTLDVTSYDTAIKGAYLTVNGGKITAWASYDQGLHGENELTINGGDVLVSASYEAMESIKMTFNGGVTSNYSTDDVWNASVASTGSNQSPSLVVNGGYHYLKITGGNDTDVMDSNGSVTFAGGVIICETGSGSTIDCDGTKTFVNTNNPILMLFGGSTEGVPGNDFSKLKISGIQANTRYSIMANNQLNSSFTTTQTASSLMYFAPCTPTFYSGGTLSGAHSVTFRTNTNSVITYEYGGALNGGNVISNTSETSASQMGGGGMRW